MFREEEFRQLNLNGRRALLAAQLPGFMEEIAAASSPISRATLKWALGAAICAKNTPALGTVLKLIEPGLTRPESYRVAPVATLAEWCERSGIQCEVLEPAKDIVLAATTRYSSATNYTTEPIRFASIPGGSWCAGWDFAIGRDGTILHDTGHWAFMIARSANPHFYMADVELVAYQSPREIVDVDADALFLSGPAANHFGHWVIDFLPRLRARQHLGKSKLKVAVLDPLTDVQRDMLRLFGVDDEDLIHCLPNIQYRFRTLHVYQPGRSTPPNPTHVEYVRSYLYPGRGASVSGTRAPPRRVFATRGKLPTRAIVNADELNVLLEEEGFAAVDFSQLSVADQQATMAEAEILMGVYGSNLFAIYFAPAGCTVIGLMTPDHPDTSILHTSSMLHMRHQFLNCARAPVTKHKKWKIDTDIYVDCDELRRRLAEF